MKKIICILTSIVLSSYTIAQESMVSTKTVGKASIEKHYQQGMLILLEAESFTLLSDSGSLVHDLSIQLSLLNGNQLAPLPSDMVNVTGINADGYRLQPSGTHFAPPATISIPYEPNLIPWGYHPADIYTYYYDEDIAQWKQLERIANARSYMEQIFRSNITLPNDTDAKVSVVVHCDSNMLLPVLSKDTAANLLRNESRVYSYHPDHLGSATWITDESGIPVQYLHYMPYGELWRNQRRTGYDERYKFTGKERDAETGYDYYSARYLWGSVGVWLSVDPLADKNPSNSPYVYCNGNPIMLIDPDGRDDVVINIDDGSTSIVQTMDNNDNFYLSHNGRINAEPFYQSEKNIFNLTKDIANSKIGTTFITNSLADAEEFLKALSTETQFYKIEGKTKETGAMFVDNKAYIMLTAEATSSIPLTSSAQEYQQEHPNALFLALIHSHPSNGGPSEADRSMYNTFSGVPHYIFQPAFGRYIEYNNKGIIGLPIIQIFK